MVTVIEYPLKIVGGDNIFVMEKLKEVPLGAVLLKHLSMTTIWPIIEQLKPEFKNALPDFNVHT